MTIKRLLRRLSDWVKGRRLDVNSAFHSMTYYQKPLLVRGFLAVIRFFRAEWKWVIGTGISLTALYLRFFAE